MTVDHVHQGLDRAQDGMHTTQYVIHVTSNVTRGFLVRCVTGHIELHRIGKWFSAQNAKSKCCPSVVFCNLVK